MNAARSDHSADADRADVRSRLPGLCDAELPFQGELRIREHLLNETRAQARTPGARTPASRWSGARTRTRRPLALVLAAGAATCALALTVALLTDGGSGAKAPAARSEPAAVHLLDRVALAAQAEPDPAVRDGQFLYTRTTGHSTSLSETANGAMEAARTDESAERWVSVDGSAGTLTRTARGSATVPGAGAGKPGLGNPTYRFLASLPTDPARLLELIRDEARRGHGAGSGSTTGPDQQAFVMIGDLLRTAEAPPGVSAALYRAAARIPGVVLVPEATDAAGRTGVAVARVHDAERTEWIFDRDSLRLLGERTVLLEDSAWGTAGTPVTSVAVVGRGVVDRAGQTP
ncbi:CU044_5270 family protein [Streptomyces xanthophaeus]|uniref:CU044_5270 family protein n=1 Tax=Streptomyces xanthophaeus TaxID=67385 RepID=UPI00386BFBDB|nr:CU044_5270 family protein [Streptomyces xanthophaeus]WST61924.1 CU044_5270 family protein [Streptomyces xanthophaeus]